MDPGGTRDEHYDLVSVLYHALHGADKCDIYLMDAEAAGRDELAGGGTWRVRTAYSIID